MKLLVITPTLGRSAYLGETIQTVKDYCSTAVHVLSVPKAEIDRLQHVYQGVLVVADRGKPYGMYGAINSALEAADADPSWSHFTYLNDDDLFSEGFADLCRKSERDDPHVAYGRVSIISKKGDRVGEYPVSRFPFLNGIFWRSFKVPTLQPGTIFSRDAVRKLGEFNQTMRLAGDADYICRAIKFGLRFQFVDVETAKFRLTPGQLSNNQREFAVEVDRVIRDNFGRPLNFVFRVLFRGLFLFLNIRVLIEHIRHFGFKSRREIFLTE